MVALLPEGLAEAAPEGPAVYFLFRGPVVVYVGASEWPYLRVQAHRRKRRFDTVLFLPVELASLESVEQHWIGLLCPRFNNLHNPQWAGGRSWGESPRNSTDRLVPLPVELWARLAAIAKKDERSVSYMGRKAVRAFVDVEENKPPAAAS